MGSAFVIECASHSCNTAQGSECIHRLAVLGLGQDIRNTEQGGEKNLYIFTDSFDFLIALENLVTDKGTMSCTR